MSHEVRYGSDRYARMKRQGFSPRVECPALMIISQRAIGLDHEKKAEFAFE